MVAFIISIPVDSGTRCVVMQSPPIRAPNSTILGPFSVSIISTWAGPFSIPTAFTARQELSAEEVAQIRRLIASYGEV